MSKKRVHELGKQLKEHGIELSNQELVEKLHALGYDVKSHSSSLEDDQAQTAFERIVGEKKPKPAPVRPAGPGFVVRKRAHTDVPPVAPAYQAPETYVGLLAEAGLSADVRRYRNRLPLSHVVFSARREEGRE
jgi:translation initiation factor IF-2